MPRPKRTQEDLVRRAAKAIGLSLSALEVALRIARGNFDGPGKIRGSAAYIRVAIRARRPHRECWTMAVLLNNQRIDGIDWEGTVHDHRGHDCTGWHRHVWSLQHKDTMKECLPGFDPQNLRQFLSEGLAILNVQLKKGGRDGGGQLLLNQTDID